MSAKAIVELTVPNRSRPNYSLTLPDADAVLNLAFQESATAGTAELADGTKPFAGFVTREVRDHELEDSVYATSRMERPFIPGELGAFEDCYIGEFEGSGYLILTGEQAISAETALKTELSFSAGKWQVAAEGQYVHGILNSKPTAFVSGNVRIEVVRVGPYLKPVIGS